MGYSELDGRQKGPFNRVQPVNWRVFGNVIFAEDDAEREQIVEMVAGGNLYGATEVNQISGGLRYKSEKEAKKALTKFRKNRGSYQLALNLPRR